MSTQVSGVENGSPAEIARVSKKAIESSRSTDVPVKEWEELSTGIKGSGGKPLNLQVRRGEETVKLTVQPTQKEGTTYFRRAQRRLDDRHRQSGHDRKRQAGTGRRQSVLPNLRLLQS